MHSNIIHAVTVTEYIYEKNTMENAKWFLVHFEANPVWNSSGFK